MTREEKIEALADAYADNICVRNSQEFRDTFNDYRNGILAGLKLALEEIGEFDASKANDGWWFADGNKEKPREEQYMDGARWQHEQIKAKLKGDV